MFTLLAAVTADPSTISHGADGSLRFSIPGAALTLEAPA